MEFAKVYVKIFIIVLLNFLCELLFFTSDSMWPVNIRTTEAMDAGIYPPGPYPEREGEPDCSFYLRTGLCRFGSTCRFNHPSNRKLVSSGTHCLKHQMPTWKIFRFYLSLTFHFVHVDIIGILACEINEKKGC